MKELKVILIRKINKWLWSFIHNCIVHPMMPFTWGKIGKYIDELHDYTAKLAFDDE